ncbi:hypothetical protein NDU88_003677 [Pleurodeles waltl]|uniref:Uncharacterized protein n=1 Tax=Pleurodeles waltl TaxID=8319 RepID=A0AAV7TPQ8_PLEWA|nr:hypothetical protein NDU88_003676 [Pleurodeles waltl]KAJ1178431.1 hypothetical protein NDU88_003677 [Pleurodeles waltl]
MHPVAPPEFRLEFNAVHPKPLDSLRVPAEFHNGLGLPCGVDSGPSSSPADSSDPHSTDGPQRDYCSPRGIRGSDSGEPRYTFAWSVEALRVLSELLQM